jgi:hypothetical protein
MTDFNNTILKSFPDFYTRMNEGREKYRVLRLSRLNQINVTSQTILQGGRQHSAHRYSNFL